MPKPFGKPIVSGLGLTRGMRFAIALLVAALPAFFIGQLAASSYPTFAERPFFWATAIVLSIFYAATTALWLRRRPSPRPPGSGRFKLFLVRFLLTLLIAFPAGLLSAFLYGPALKLVNGMLSPGGPEIEHAMVDRTKTGDVVLHFPYQEPGSGWTVPYTRFVPKDPAPWAKATLTLRRGLLGARWIQKIEYEPLK